MISILGSYLRSYYRRGNKGNIEFITYCSNSQSSIPPLVFNPKVQSHEVSVSVSGDTVILAAVTVSIIGGGGLICHRWPSGRQVSCGLSSALICFHSRPKWICTPASPQAPTTLGTAISRPRYARCARPRVEPFLTCLGRYLLNGSNRFVRRWRVIADVTLLVQSNFSCIQVRCAT
jgi:hypothetical protein